MNPLKALTALFARQPTAPVDTAWIGANVQRVGDQLSHQVVGGLRQAQRSFSAGETTPWTASWSTTQRHINDLLAMQLPTLWARAQGLARDDEWATRYLIQLRDNVLGERGIELQARVRASAGGFDKNANQALETFWRQWGRRGSCEVTGTLSWREVEWQLLRSLATEGAYLYRHRASGPYGFQIQLLPVQALDVSLRRDWGGNRVRMGIEVNDDGTPQAYWLLATRSGESAASDITQVGKHIRVPAAEIRHRFLAEETGQLRGTPWLTVGARRLWLLHEFEEAAAVASNNAAKRQGFFVSPDGNAPPGFAETIVNTVLDTARAQGKVLSNDEIAALTASAQKYNTLMPGQFDTLPTGYDFRAFESKWPEVNASGFIKDQIRGFAAARGVSYHTLGNDLSDVNYSSAQVGILDERAHFSTTQTDLAGWLHQDVAEQVFTRAPIYNTSLRASRRDDYLAALEWHGRNWAPIDPRKSAEADDIKLRNKSTSRRRIWIAQGLDPDDMAAEIAEEEKRFGPLDATANTTPSSRDARDAADLADDARPTSTTGATARALRAVAG